MVGFTGESFKAKDFYLKEGISMSGYIMDLRKLVGHRPLLQVGASVILVDEEGRILLQKRKDNHLWAYHGGSVELDEDTEAAARRELYEETGIIAEDMKLFGVFSGPQTHYVYPNGDEVSNVDVVYICRKWSGSLKGQESEVEELKFFSPEDVPGDDMLFPCNIPALRRFISNT